MTTNSSIRFLIGAVVFAGCSSTAHADVTIVITKKFTDLKPRKETTEDKQALAFGRAILGSGPVFAFAEGKPVLETAYFSGNLERHDTGGGNVYIIDHKKGTLTELDPITKTYTVSSYQEAVIGESARSLDLHPKRVTGTSTLAGHKVRHYVDNRVEDKSNVFEKKAKIVHTTDVWTATDLPATNPLKNANLFDMASVDRMHGVPGTILRVTMHDPGSIVDLRVTSYSTKPIPAKTFAVPAGYTNDDAAEPAGDNSAAKSSAATSSAAINDDDDDKPLDRNGKPIKPFPIATRPIDLRLANAIVEDDVDGVKSAIAAGASVNVNFRSMDAAFDADSETLLGVAVWYDEAEVVQALLVVGVKPDVHGTETKMAIANGNTTITGILLNHGGYATVEMLDVAISKRQLELARVIVPHITGIDGKDRNGMTPLVLASGGGDVALVDAILKRGADVNLVDGVYTPLIEAARYGRSDVVKLLLDHGASATAKNLDGKTAIDIANDGFHPVTLKLLQEAQQKQ